MAKTKKNSIKKPAPKAAAKKTTPTPTAGSSGSGGSGGSAGSAGKKTIKK